LPRSLGKLLKDNEYEVLDIRECGLRGAEDKKIYEFAQREQGIILTGDSGFGNILQYPVGKHYGIVIALFPNEMPTDVMNRQLLEQLQEISEADFKGNLIIIEPGRTRIRRAKKSTPEE
jgi:predicted nuclease of predicted toxin-antitoxin system